MNLMNISLSFIQIVFSIICILFSVSFSTHYLEGGLSGINLAVGVLAGGMLAGLFYCLDLMLKQFNFKAFNTAAVGLLFSGLMGAAVMFILSGILNIDVDAESLMPVRFFVYLTCAYFGLSMTARAAQEIHLNIPFFEFKQITQKKKDILVDVSILNDSRVLDLALTGLLDHHLIFPRFALKKLYSQAEIGDEVSKTKARRALETLKKLESMQSLDLRYAENDFPEIKDPTAKLAELARFLDTHIITSDMNLIQQSSIEGVRIINIHMLSNALKPVTQAGEVINIKIQRYGKEARQGVGYLEDGTMVVVNGGAEFIGDTIKAYVLSVKHTTSGRMIFCNASEEGELTSENGYLSEMDESNSSLPNALVF